MLTDNTRKGRRARHYTSTYLRMSYKIDNMGTVSEDIEEIRQDLIQCSICLRRMRHEVFIKHPSVCRKNPLNQRHAHKFDMTQYRSIKAGDTIIPVNKISPLHANKANNIHERPSQTRHFKRIHHSSSIVPPVIDNFCCPICKRKFCEKAYDQHVAFCTSKTKQIQQMPSEEILLARLRLSRRMKFGVKQVSPIPSKNFSFNFTQTLS